MNIDLVEVVGWIGAVLVTGSYFLNMQGKLDAKDVRYIWANAIGGICFVVNTYFHQAYPSMVVNIIWVLIAAAAVFHKK